ncbi:MAG: FAD-dependent oxidoreductase [Candidatus Moranbacteria bacterium]|nr:FAD-dependent oxidoreductase [Candidatus Moranbacteria bacterium]
MEKKYDLVIVGAGPAGLGASIYASRYKMSNLVIASEIGGQVVEASEIENWAGEKLISGKELMDKFIDQAKSLGGEIIQDDVKKIEKKNGSFEIHTGKGEKYEAKGIILALGMKPRRMNIKGEEGLVGKGVSYCATCDASFFKEKDVVVIGGGDAAAMAATHLSEFANKVYLVYRKDGIAWNPAREEEARENPKVEMHSCDNIKEIKGEDKVTGLVYECGEGEKELSVSGVFVEIGSVPGVAIAIDLGVKTDDKSYIIVDQTQETNIENVFAAGDVTTGSNKFRQIITAVAEGAIAAGSAYKKLKLK